MQQHQLQQQYLLQRQFEQASLVCSAPLSDKRNTSPPFDFAFLLRHSGE